MDSSRLAKRMSMTVSVRSGCGRISGLSVEACGLRAIMDSRAPRADRGDGFKEPGLLSAWCGVGPTDGPSSCLSLSISVWQVLSDGVLRRHGPGERHVAGPHRPDDAPQFVGDGDRGFVVATSLLHGQRPVLQVPRRLRRREIRMMIVRRPFGAPRGHGRP
jgi:hypothetical protein